MSNPSTLTVRAAREEFFRTHGFTAADYDAPWFRFRVGPVPLAFPNLEAHKRALRVHDLHHIATGYGTDLRGEAEISAWELAAGCKGDWVALVAGAVAVAAGLVLAPRRTWRAWQRGRGCRTLYGSEVTGELLNLSVAELRQRLALPVEA